MMLPIVADSFNDMYYRGGVLVGEEIRANKGEVISFDTYFNSFCQGSYKSHTVVENIKITINLKGSFCVQLMHAKGTFLRNKAENEQVMPYIEDAVDVQETVLQQHNFESSTPTELCFEQSLASIKEGGITYLKLISKQDGSTCHGFTIASKQPPKQAVKLAIVICTYKREQYVYNNINRLKSSPYWGDFGVIVVDNGQTLCDIDGVNIVKNANTGGSGGFTRGMLEAEQNGFTHFLLMDDDIEFCDETVQRTKRFMEYAKDADRLTLGASMLVMGKGYLQYEKGAEWHGRGLSTSERGYDLRQNKAVIVNDNYINQKDYTAWWYCCMSTKTLARIGKPLPFFIKGDDIEYGLRAQNTVLVNNGIGVWHESFESKYSGVLSYYIRRNEMILNIH